MIKSVSLLQSKKTCLSHFYLMCCHKYLPTLVGRGYHTVSKMQEKKKILTVSASSSAESLEMFSIPLLNPKSSILEDYMVQRHCPFAITFKLLHCTHWFL